MAFSVKFKKLLPVYPDKIMMQWDIIDPVQADCIVFDVYRAGGPCGPWEQLVFGKTDIYNHIDVAAGNFQLLAHARDIYYRVVATPATGASDAVEAISRVELKHEPVHKNFNIFRKAQYDLMLGLKNLNGTLVSVLKQKHWGPRCDVCYDAITKEVITEACTNCYGTSFVGGYFDPCITYMRISAGPTNTQLTPEGYSDTVLRTVTTLDFPELEPDDILVFHQDNSRWLVKQPMETELKMRTVHQKALVAKMETNAIHYRIPADPNSQPPIF